MFWSPCTKHLEISFENLKIFRGNTHILPGRNRHFRCLGSLRWDFKLIFEGTVVGLAAKLTLKTTLLLDGFVDNLSE